MPTYDYFCSENGRSVEVMHGMSTTLQTWGAVCDAAGLEPGATATHTPVEKLLGTGMVLTNSRANPTNCAGPTPQGGCCGGGCGMPS